MDMKVKGDILIHTPANNKTNIKTDGTVKMDKSKINKIKQNVLSSIFPKYIFQNIGNIKTKE